MQKLNIKDGLLYTSINLIHDGREIVIDDVIIDTGAFHTIIAPEFLDELDVGFSEDDRLDKAFIIINIYICLCCGRIFY
jgi:hypothetical protein